MERSEIDLNQRIVKRGRTMLQEKSKPWRSRTPSEHRKDKAFGLLNSFGQTNQSQRHSPERSPLQKCTEPVARATADF